MTSERKSVLVTGAGGFVGRFATQALATDYDVTGLGIEERPDWLPAGVDWQQVDLLDPQSISALRPEWWGVIHLAGHTVPSSFADERALRDNVEMTRNLLDALDIGRMLFASSALVYAPSRTPLIEDSPIEPQGPYGMSKHLCEKLLGEYSDRTDIRIARPFNHVGPNMQPQLAIPSIVRRVRSSMDAEGPIEMLGQDSTRDFVDVRDVVRAYRCILDLEAPKHDTYNVCTGQPTSIRSVVETAVGIIGIQRQIRFAEEAVSEDDTSWLVGDSTLLRRETGWEPEFTLEESLRDMLADP